MTPKCHANKPSQVQENRLHRGLIRIQYQIELAA
jgi:hypothetical protein